MQDRSWGPIVRREVVALAVLIALAVAVFFLTRAAAAAHRRLRLQDAQTWYSTGTARLAAGDPEGAADALRRAAAMSRTNQTYQLALATALSAANAVSAARQVLVQLRDRAPESGDVNLRLARLEADRGDVTAALRYYQSAVHGIWPTDSPEQRRSVRVEFIRYLLDHDQKSRALAELLVLEGNLPLDPDVHVAAGDLFMQAEDSRRALAHFETALELNPRSADALVGAAHAAFDRGEYARARRYLRATDDPRASSLRPIVDLVLTRDPLAPRISLAERRRRLQMNLDAVAQRLADCGADVGDLLVQTNDFLAQLKVVRQPDEIIEDGVELVRRVEERAQESCGPLRPIDRALLIIGRRHAGAAP